MGCCAEKSEQKKKHSQLGTYYDNIEGIGCGDWDFRGGWVGGDAGGNNEVGEDAGRGDGADDGYGDCQGGSCGGDGD